MYKKWRKLETGTWWLRVSFVWFNVCVWGGTGGGARVWVCSSCINICLFSRSPVDTPQHFNGFNSPLRLNVLLSLGYDFFLFCIWWQIFTVIIFPIFYLLRACNLVSASTVSGVGIVTWNLQHITHYRFFTVIYKTPAAFILVSLGSNWVKCPLFWRKMSICCMSVTMFLLRTSVRKQHGDPTWPPSLDLMWTHTTVQIVPISE